MADDDELRALEAHLRRRRRLAKGLFAAVLASPLVLIGYCVQKACFQDPHTYTTTLSDDEVRAVREVARANQRATGEPVRFAAPAAILAQLHTAAPGDAPCPIVLRSRAVGSRGYEAPKFDLVQLTDSELAAATPDDAATGGDEIEVVFVVASRIDGFSDGLTFTPGRVRGRAYLWRRSAGRIVCAGDIAASSSATIDVTRQTINGAPVTNLGGQDDGALGYDLDRQVEQAIAVGMHAVGAATDRR